MPRPPVLIVDDARTTRTHMKLLLEGTYQVQVAASGEEGLALARQLGPGLSAVLLDVQMPGMGGIECLRAIKGDEALAGVPVVMVTTRGEEETLAKCRDLGCDGYVTKPVQSKELFDVLRNLLRARG